MPISSMTGFARIQGQHDDRAWTWEVRSVNGRGLDVRSRLPGGYESLEIPVRERVGRWLKRGNVLCSLNVTRTAGQSGMRVNTDILDQVIALLPTIQSRLPESRPVSAEGLLALRGVIDVMEDDPTDEARETFHQVLLDGLDQTLRSLTAMRTREGERLGEVLHQQVERIAVLSREADHLAAVQPAAILQRLREQLAALGEQTPPLPEDRLAQEAALLATRADTREEIDRLKAHSDAARALLGSDGPVGRRLDFLCQEFNREANTLCSKAQDVSLTRIGLDLKASIDQLREQSQNIE